MFYIFIMSVITTFIVFSLLFARLLRTINPRLIRRNIYLKIFAVNALLLAFLYVTKFLPLQFPLLSLSQRLIIICFVSEIFLSAFYVLAKVFFYLLDLWTRTHAAKPVDISRRKFLAQTLLLPVEGAVLYGSVLESSDIIVKKHTVKIKQAGDFAGLKIAHLTDVHIGSYFTMDKLRETLERLAGMHADVLAITGDIFDDDRLNKQAISIVDSYNDKFTYGIYYCWGNHEYFRDITAIRANLAKTSIRLLQNDNIVIHKKNSELCLLGVDYPHDRRIFSQQAKQYMDTAMQQVPENSIKILLAHHSDFIDNGFANNIDLTLTGHTHGGQIGILGQPVFPGFKYVRGMFKDNDKYGYVSTGAGSWFPFRLGCPPEITLFIIV